MGCCIIIGAGECAGLLRPVEKSDCLIAADGGLAHVKDLGLTPDVILGDFDSLGYVPEGANVFPARKDDTDTMLAIRRGLALGYHNFLIYGGLDGPRLDHTLANIQSLLFLNRRGCRGALVGTHSIALIAEPPGFTLSGPAGGLLSLFSLGGQTEGVTLRGLEYPLENGSLPGDFPLGVSNHFLGGKAEIALEAGRLLAVYDRKAGLPTDFLGEAQP